LVPVAGGVEFWAWSGGAEAFVPSGWFAYGREVAAACGQLAATELSEALPG
jgi:hypothetical protein